MVRSRSPLKNVAFVSKNRKRARNSRNAAGAKARGTAQWRVSEKIGAYTSEIVSLQRKTPNDETRLRRLFLQKKDCNEIQTRVP